MKMPPVMRYHGGKWRIADWVLSHFPPADAYDSYVESFSGAASVLMRKPRSQYEVYNDLDSDICNVFRVLRDPESADQLAQLLIMTPYARDEFYLTYDAPPLRTLWSEHGAPCSGLPPVLGQRRPRSAARVFADSRAVMGAA